MCGLNGIDKEEGELPFWALTKDTKVPMDRNGGEKEDTWITGRMAYKSNSYNSSRASLIVVGTQVFIGCVSCNFTGITIESDLCSIQRMLPPYTF